MADVNVGELYDLYVKAFEAGNVDPGPFTSQVEGEDRADLETMIENFLVSTPAAEWDEAAYRESISFRMAPEVVASLSGTSGDLPEVLVGLRVRMKIKVGEVENRLAKLLGARSPEEVELVRDYYHQLEYGTLPARPVSDKVFAALADIFKTSAGKLRAAGEALGPQPDHVGGPVYARVAGAVRQKKGMMSPGSLESTEMADAMAPAPAEPASKLERLKERKRSHIDDLFLGDAG